MFKAGEAGKLAWIMWWVGLSAFVATIADRELAAFRQRVIAKEELIASFGTRDREALEKTTAIATAQSRSFKDASARVNARRAAMPEAGSTGWLVALIHDLARTTGCVIEAVDLTTRPADPKESGLTWLAGTAHLRGPYPAVRAFAAALTRAPQGQATGGLPLRQLSLARADKATDLSAEIRFEVLAR